MLPFIIPNNYKYCHFKYYIYEITCYYILSIHNTIIGLYHVSTNVQSLQIVLNKSKIQQNKIKILGYPPLVLKNSNKMPFSNRNEK